MADYKKITCVVNMGDAARVSKIAKECGVKGTTASIGHGIAHKHLSSIWGLSDERKEIIFMIADAETTAKTTERLCEEMAFHKHNHGIAFVMNVHGYSGCLSSGGKKDVTKEVKDTMYKIIYVVVEKGRGEDVVTAAEKAGARGGTIMNARGAGIHEVEHFFSMDIEPEKETVFIITKSEQQDAIVKSIKTEMNLDEPGNGIMFIMDINEAYGLYDGNAANGKSADENAPDGN